MQGAACPRILVIAGTDSSGGAGLTRDTATATALGCHVAPVVTAVTVQTSQALSRISAMPVKMVHAQMAAALEEAPVAAVKIGMLGNAGIARAIAQGLPRDIPVVLDPVLKTSSGGLLGTGQSLAPLMEKVTLLTPNLSESAFLSGQPFSEEPEALRWHAEILMAAGSTRGPEAILIKGGHASGEESRDHLFFADAHAVFAARRLPRGRRGTGCTLATAIACYLARGQSMEAACALGKRHVTDWLKQGPGVPAATPDA
ncbi:bifunctional hydroxymethylpyrimidine kinase/phosphomethylpyrimidine kinase [Phycobacter azelaicus]|uniref:bifunctional hydroxymethylpyrimidine kinase/phosphomethylpyrimidine kinase n=1 Tax=Phycobacter azelaicus TaxID=2668075 RepID=UPI001865D7FF|nr:hydroxymethylpyrimidine/phosphomethylpyrimidine kinase [Phycobacter azelaicus]MBE1297252.1 hydroxymethylpyrimidine/phosphomethylpyrimidine kinase [Paracoccaceae bacterium]